MAYIMATCRHTKAMKRVFRRDGKRYDVCQCWMDWLAREPDTALAWLNVLGDSVVEKPVAPWERTS